jgi:hypothetical protein
LRQVGIVAAAGLEALETFPEQLREDHRSLPCSRAAALATAALLFPR